MITDVPSAFTCPLSETLIGPAKETVESEFELPLWTGAEVGVLATDPVDDNLIGPANKFFVFVAAGEALTVVEPPKTIGPLSM